MNQPMHVHAYNDKIVVIVCSAKVFGPLMVAMDIPRIKFLPGYRTLSILGAVQRYTIVVVGRGTVWD